MSLLDEMKTTCVLLDRKIVPDGMGGYNPTWTDGAQFEATIIKNNSNEVLVAEKQGVSEVFTIVVDTGMPLDYHDVFRRVSDGEIFRVTSKVEDSQAPMRSTVQISKVTAERWALPDE